MKAIVTDHALIRWLERVRGIDMEALRAELAAEVQPLVDIRAYTAPCGDCWYVMDGAKLVTIVPEKPDHKQKSRHQREKVNGTGIRGERMPWQGQKRRRPHK